MGASWLLLFDETCWALGRRTLLANEPTDLSLLSLRLLVSVTESLPVEPRRREAEREGGGAALLKLLEEELVVLSFPRRRNLGSLE